MATVTCTPPRWDAEGPGQSYMPVVGASAANLISKSKAVGRAHKGKPHSLVHNNELTFGSLNQTHTQQQLAHSVSFTMGTEIATLHDGSNSNGPSVAKADYLCS